MISYRDESVMFKNVKIEIEGSSTHSKLSKISLVERDILGTKLSVRFILIHTRMLPYLGTVLPNLHMTEEPPLLSNPNG